MLQAVNEARVQVSLDEGIKLDEEEVRVVKDVDVEDCHGIGDHPYDGVICLSVVKNAKSLLDLLNILLYDKLSVVSVDVVWQGKHASMGAELEGLQEHLDVVFPGGDLVIVSMNQYPDESLERKSLFFIELVNQLLVGLWSCLACFHHMNWVPDIEGVDSGPSSGDHGEEAVNERSEEIGMWLGAGVLAVLRDLGLG